jgi:protein phosphatase
MSHRWWSSTSSNIGQRLTNEDAILSLDELGLWVVADGMGGHLRGDLASRFVVEAMENIQDSDSIDAFAREVRRRISFANTRIRKHAATLGDTEIVGSTVVAVMVQDDELICLWAGDSRAYLLSGDRLKQLTHDHTAAQEFVDGGNLDGATAKRHASTHILTRAVGAQESIKLDEYRGQIRDGDALLLCSDGLINEVDEDELAPILEDFDCEEACQELVDLSLERGSRDNVTVTVIRFEATTGIPRDTIDHTAVNFDFRLKSGHEAAWTMRL